MEYTQTVNLPKTDFSMKANLTQKEPEYLKRWEVMGLYQKQQEKRKNAPAFILHDGPPYANGEIHVGTALNKILKDMINKYKFSKGFRVPYVPGWDCHGLPIELKVVEKLGEKADKVGPVILRSECRKYAEKFVKVQMDGFKRLGVFADWANPYLTMSEEYEAAIIEAFGQLVEKGYIYRGQRPVHWCPNCGTSLAEAEIEYHDHTSPAIFVKFPVADHSIEKLKNKKFFVLIWTTTPWTLPANTGLSFHPEEKYCAVRVGDEYLLMAEKLKDSVLSVKGLKEQEIVFVSREDIKTMKVNHPWIDRESKPVFGIHVTMDTGAGIVHTAPGHGMEDYLMGTENNLPQLSPVNDRGQFTKEVPEFEGMNVFDANEKIIEFLDKKGVLYYRQNITHSYPHCWRCKKPIIFRSKPQWFFKVSDKKLQAMVLNELPKIKWVPEWGQQRIKNMLEGRPDWCLSRQRQWGVPIPAFYCRECGEAMLDKKTIDHIIGIVKKEGIDVWYKKEANELAPQGTKCPKCGSKNLSKETDILDVWFDSGVSHYAVLDKREGLSSPADVYLEGNDQYRGWFQSSLWPSVAIKGHAPYKTIVTHGWMLDEQGKQMHKSLGNAVSPREVTEKFGADVLRLWTVTEDYRGDLRIGENLIQKSAESYRKIRNTFRYLLSNLDGFDQNQALKYNDLMDADQYALSMLYRLNKSVEKTNDDFEFYKSFREIYNFCAVDLSSFYLDILKDRLYIYPKNSRERLSAQTAMSFILEQLMLMLVPILPFTMEEVFRSYFSKDENDSVHLQTWKDVPEEWNNEALFAEFSDLMKVRETVLKAVEFLRSDPSQKEPIGSGLAARVEVKPLNQKFKDLLLKHVSYLRYFFIVSEAQIADNLQNIISQDENTAVFAEKVSGKKCSRCWNYSKEVGNFEDHPELCERCYPIVKESK
jgi:isoleucyl-tRNA synthetase